MVEFALVAPVFFMMLFGVIEFSLITASITTYNFAAKDAARIGSVLGRTDPTVDEQIIEDVIGRSGGIVVARAQLIEIFQSDVGGTLPAGVNPVENAYPPVTNATCSVCSWAVASRRDNLLSADYLGVRITYVYTYLTAFVSGGASQLQLSAVSVQRIEPQSFQGRRAPPNVPTTSALNASAPSCGLAGAGLSLRPHSPSGDSANCAGPPVAWLRQRPHGVWDTAANAKGDVL